MAAIVRLRGASRVLKSPVRVLGLGLPGGSDDGSGIPTPVSANRASQAPRSAGSRPLQECVELRGAFSASSGLGARRFAAVASVGDGDDESFPIEEGRAIADAEDRVAGDGGLATAMFASADSLVNVTGDDVLKYITFSEEDQSKYFGEGLPGGVVKEFEATKTSSLMIRPKVLQLCNFLERHVTGKDAFTLPAEDASQELLNNNHLPEANDVFIEGLEGGLQGTHDLFDRLVDANCKTGDHGNAISILCLMEYGGRMSTTFHYNCLLMAQVIELFGFSSLGGWLNSMNSHSIIKAF